MLEDVTDEKLVDPSYILDQVGVHMSIAEEVNDHRKCLTTTGSA